MMYVARVSSFFEVIPPRFCRVGFAWVQRGNGAPFVREANFSRHAPVRGNFDCSNQLIQYCLSY
jgi:hypothetical protein